MKDKLIEMKEILETVSGENIVIYDFDKTSPFYDYFVIATTNERQASAAIGYFKKSFDTQIRHIEGKGGSWVLIDCYDVVVHLLSKEDRAFYNFENRLLGIKKVEI